MVAIPGSDTQIELLAYEGCERRSGATSPADFGTGHFCLFVDGIDELYARAAASKASPSARRAARSR